MDFNINNLRGLNMEFIKTEDEVITEKRVAREILSMTEEICFSKKFSE